MNMNPFDYHKKRKRRSSFSGRNSHRVRHKHHNENTGKSRTKKRKTGWIFGGILTVIVVLVLAGIGGFTYLRHSGKNSLMEYAKSSGPNLGEEQDQLGLVSRNGKYYRYNEQGINLLCMGIDKTTEESLEEEQSEGQNGQADVIFLVHINPQDNTLKILGINRDTMTDIRMYDVQGKYLGEGKAQLALGFSYGDGGSGSAELMVQAVSKLLYDLPIHGYGVLRVNAIDGLNDAVGGVTVTLPEDMILNGQSYTAGSVVHLDGVKAREFIQYRDSENEENVGSNLQRMERQKTYAVSYLNTMKEALKSRPTLATDLYQEFISDMITSISLDEAVYLVSLLPSMKFDSGDMIGLAGEVKKGTLFAEYYLDEDALLDTMLEIFYTEVAPDGTPEESEEIPQDGEEAESDGKQSEIDFEILKEKNPDIYAWIRIPGTEIDYPVLQSKVGDDKYMAITWDGQPGEEGAIFSESANAIDFSDPHTILYGHNMKDGTMFAGLHEYENEEFFKNHQDILIYTPEETIHYRIFAAYLYDNRNLLESFDFDDPSVMKTYQKFIMDQRSLYVNLDHSVNLSKEDQILTLSTRNTEDKNRYLVQAVRIK